MAAFRRAYDIIQQTIESLDNPAITSFEIDGISLRLDYLTRTLVNLDSNCAPTDGTGEFKIWMLVCEYGKQECWIAMQAYRTHTDECRM